MSKKRSNGEGTVTKRKNGTWRGQLMIGYKVDGSPHRVNFSGKTKSEVLDKIREYKNKAEETSLNSSNLLFSAWADIWYKNYKSQVQPSTYSGYKYTLNLLKGYFEHIQLQSIILMDINEFLDWLSSEGYSMSQIRKCRAMLIQIFDYAEDNSLITRNPARRSKLTKVTDFIISNHKEIKDSFTEDEVALLEKELPNDMLGNSIRLMLYSGLRTQELLALTKDDIAFDGSVIRVNKAIKTVNGKPTLGTPKSKTSNRTIPIPADKRKYAVYLRENGGSEFIWSIHSKNPLYSVGSFRRRYYTAIKKIAVRPLSPHCCRHTYVTRLQARGVPMEIIANLVGHSEVNTTNIYLHTSLETLQDAVLVFNN